MDSNVSPTSRPVQDSKPSPRARHTASPTNKPSISFTDLASTSTGLDGAQSSAHHHSVSHAHTTALQEGIRRPSIQFTGQAKAGLPSTVKRSASSTASVRRRMSSPPPPPVFQNRVSFDTFEKKYEGLSTSFNLVRKHKDYEYTRQTRTFLCGIDDNDYSEYALEWLIDELVDDGDELVCLRVVEKDSSVAGSTSIEEGKYREAAEKLMKFVEEANHENKAINIILEFAVGKVEKVISSMIKLYEPAILIVGTRGRNLGGFQGLLPGSVSKYCLQNSPVPVIVVRPNSQRARTKRKREKNPHRHAYKDLLDKAGTDSGDLFENANPEGSIASDDEAAAVAKAIGIMANAPRESKSSPLVRMESAHTDEDSPSSQAVSDRDMSPDELQLRRGSVSSAAAEAPFFSAAEGVSLENEAKLEEEGASTAAMKTRDLDASASQNP